MGRRINILRNEVVGTDYFSSSIKKVVDIEILRDADQDYEDEEVAEEAGEQTDAVSSEKLALGRKERQHRRASDRADERDDVAHLNVALAVTVDVIDVPSDESAKSAGAEELNGHKRILLCVRAFR